MTRKSVSTDSSEDWSPKARWFLIGVFVGMIVQTWRMVRLPIDEYHTHRMEIETRLEEIREAMLE